MQNNPKKVIWLSLKSLTKIYEWCQANQDDRLAMYYMALSNNVNRLKQEEERTPYYEVNRRLRDLAGRKPKIAGTWVSIGMAYQARDEFGRSILNALKNGKLK